MKKYLITLNGCEDTTYCELELNDNELEFLIKISKEINKYSDCECQPTISIYEDYKNLDGKRDFRLSGNFNIETRTYDWEATDLVQESKNAIEERDIRK